jgi:hypothetical protein
MFSSIFYKNKFPNDEKMKKIMKESMDKYIHSLDEKYKNSQKTNSNEQNNTNAASLINFFPFIIFGLGVYHLYKGFL